MKTRLGRYFVVFLLLVSVVLLSDNSSGAFANSKRDVVRQIDASGGGDGDPEEWGAPNDLKQDLTTPPKLDLPLELDLSLEGERKTSYERVRLLLIETIIASRGVFRSYFPFIFWRMP